MSLAQIISLASATVSVVALIAAAWLYLRREPDLRDLDAERLASIQLHRIGVRLNVARARAEIHRDALTFKDRLREELNSYGKGG
jgi:hypothetical protein